MTADLDSLGTFDVVLYLGVVYHIKEPLTALERVRRVTREVAVVETEAIDVAGYEDGELVRFVAGNQVNRDFGNWYVPSIVALRSLCLAAGFSRVETVVGPPQRAASSVVERVRRLRGPPVDHSVPSGRPSRRLIAPSVRCAEGLQRHRLARVAWIRPKGTIR